MLGQAGYLAAGPGAVLGRLPERFRAEDDVLQHGEILAQGEVLVHHADAGGDGGLRRAGGQAAAEGLDVSRVGDVVAEEDRHQGGLAGAVLAQQGEDLAGAQVQRDGVVGGQPAEALGDAVQAQDGFGARGGIGAQHRLAAGAPRFPAGRSFIDLWHRQFPPTRVPGHSGRIIAQAGRGGRDFSPPPRF